MSKSQVINNDLNPKWNEDFKILVHEHEQKLRPPYRRTQADCQFSHHLTQASKKDHNIK